jgi:hypothetical protein
VPHLEFKGFVRDSSGRGGGKAYPQKQRQAPLTVMPESTNITRARRICAMIAGLPAIAQRAEAGAISCCVANATLLRGPL